MQTSKMIAMPGIDARVVHGLYQVVPMTTNPVEDVTVDADDIGITFQAGPYPKSNYIALKDGRENLLNWNSKVAENVADAAAVQPALSPQEQPHFCCFESVPSPLTPSGVEQLQSTAFMLAPSVQDPLTVQQFDRQTSLSVAMEVLGQTHSDFNLTLDLYPPTPSPSENHDDQYIQHPSPSFAYVTDGLQRVRSVSESLECVNSGVMDDDLNCRQRALSSDCSFIQANEQTITCCDMTRQVSNETSQGGNVKSPDSTSKSDDSVANFTGASDPGSVTQDEGSANSLRSLPSFVRASFENPFPDDASCEHGIDLEDMLQDFLDDADKNLKAQARMKESIAADHAYSAKKQTISFDNEVVSPVPTANTIESSVPVVPVQVIVNVSGQVSSTSTDTAPKMKRTPSYIKKRMQNNRACRESRRKRKTERDEAEIKVKTLAEENAAMRIHIEQLIKEVKETREQLIARMTAQDG